MTRIQQERFFNEEDYLRLKGCYSAGRTSAWQLAPAGHAGAPSRCPASTRSSWTMDSDPRAAYFDQVHNGVYIRMAIILALLGIADPITGKKVLEA